MHRSVSEPSLGTINSNIATTIASHATLSPTKFDKSNGAKRLRGSFLFEGRLGHISRFIFSESFYLWFRRLVLLCVVYKYITHFLKAYYLKESLLLLDLSTIICEFVYALDVLIHLLHTFWPILRVHMRINRRSLPILIYDVITLIPFSYVLKHRKGFENIALLGRWLSIGRIYRLFAFFIEINENMQTSRKMLYFLEHVATVALILHAGTCMWFDMNYQKNTEEKWPKIGFPANVESRRIKFNSYSSCWYYCACRLFNVIFGDSFPLRNSEKWLTSGLMLAGYVFFRYRFIGCIAWEVVLSSNRMCNFVDRYHHMVRYLKQRNAPPWLLQQAIQYKQRLWIMKNGILNTPELQKLPLPLQMELIYDINVAHFHDSLLFRDTGEAFMRQISLLMTNQFFLTGQYVWSQGVVKCGMVYIKRGVLEMLSDEDDESPMIAFKQGTVLGELSLFYSIPSKVTVRAATYVELQVLRRTDFMRVISEHPAMLEHIREKISSRLKSSRRRQAIMKYDKDDSRLIRTRYRPMKVLKDNLAGAEAEDPTFVDDSHMYYKDENNVRQPKFTPEFLELYQMTNNVTTIDTPRICLRSTFPWILEPNTDFIYMFDMAHFVMVLYLCVMAPHIAIQNSQTATQRVLFSVVLAGLLLNIYIQLTTAIIGRDEKKVTVKEIAEVKMSLPGFYLDIISVFPAFIFCDTLDPQGVSVAGQVTKLLPVLQVWHIWDYFAKWERNFDANIKFLSLLKYCLIFLIFCYWSGCLLYLFACPKKLCREDTWMSQLIYWETKVFMTNEAKHERPILSSFSFGSSVFTNSGSSDVAPGFEDHLLVVLIFVFGAYLACFYTARICSLYLLLTQRKQKFKESMREFFYFLSVNHVSSKITSRVKKFFCVQWYYNNAVSTNELFEDVSSNIQQEVLSIEMVESLLFCPLFQECNRDFLQTVAASTRTIVLPDNEIVQHAADIGRDMYILQKGHCNLLNHFGKIERSIGPGNDIGVMEMLFGLPKVYTALTSTNCILLHVEYTALVQCWGTFPDISHPIITVMSDPEVTAMTKAYEEVRPLTGKLDAKINRIAQELKESFVLLNGRAEREQYVRTYDRLGVMRYLRYLFFPGCITPHGIFLKMWCAARLLVALVYITVMPYEIAIKQHKHFYNYNYLDIFLYIDIMVMAYVAFYNKKSLLVTHPLLIVSRYLKHAFLLDIVSVFPFEQLVRIVNDGNDLDLYRVNRILLVARVTSAFSYWESDIMRLSPAVVLLKFLPIAMTVVNVATAFVYIHSCNPFLPPNSTHVMVNCTRAMILTGTKHEVKYALSEYIFTFYWVFEIFVGVGCTPVMVSGLVNVWLMTALQITGLLYFSFMFGYVASTRSATSHALLDHTEKTRDLGNFLDQKNVEPTMTVKTLKYFEYVWKRTNGSNPQQICRRLNSALMEDTLVFMYERALREVPLFGKVEKSFIRVITQHLKEMYFLKGDTVIQCRDVQSSIYIIYRGKADVLTYYNEMITCMGPGGMFGNFTGQPISSSEVTVYASRSLDLLMIPSQTFFNLVKYYPKIQEPLNKAFETSRNYILPITMDVGEDSSSDESDEELISLESTSKSDTSRSDGPARTGLRSSQSQSNISQAKSATSTLTYQSQLGVNNLLRPGSLLYQTFGYVTCIMATGNYVLTLYEIVTLNDCYIVFWLSALFDIFFYIKTYVTMHQGYINKHGEFIIDGDKCRRRYFKHKMWVWTDLLVIIPLELFAFCFRRPQRVMHYLRANKLLRVKYLIEFYQKTSVELTNNLTVLQLFMTIIVVVLLIHTSTCVWLVTLTATSPVSFIRPLKMHLIDEVTSQRKWDYTTSFYVVVSELTMTGGDEFVTEDMAPMIIIAFILICGKILAALVVATAIQVAYTTKHALTCYEKNTAELIDFLKNQGLSNYQLKKLWVYVQQLWVTERGRQLPALLEQAPYVKRCNLMTAMFGHHLRNCYLFADTGESFLRQVTAVLEYTIYFPGNYIVVAGDSEAQMFWVASGSVSVVSVRADLTETTHALLGAGDMFGIMQGLHRGVSHCFSYRAETKVSILTLSLDSWINILPFFPEAKTLITNRSEVLFAQI